jgi:predicted DNA-binding protein with PD1-like motif
MKYSEAKTGRVFVLRLEDGEVLHDEIERFAREKSIRAATVIAVGAADAGSRLIVGPEDGDALPVEPMEHALEAAHEVAGVGTLFPGEDGQPMLHMHVACGRGSNTVTGCVRRGVKTWRVLELVLLELVGSTCTRKLDETTGFQLLEP